MMNQRATFHGTPVLEPGQTWRWPRQAERRLVLSVSIGDDLINRWTEPARAKYAERVGASCLTLRDYLPVGDSPHWEKLRIADYLRQGYRVLWVDSDVLIEDGAPDIFGYVAPEEFGAVDEVRTAQWAEHHPGLEERVVELAWTTGFPMEDRPDQYWNTGVMVASPCHEDVFNLAGDDPVSDCVFEQTWLNLSIARQYVRMCSLPRYFNNMQNFRENRPSHGQFLHAAGRAAAAKVRDLLEVAEAAD